MWQDIRINRKEFLPPDEICPRMNGRHWEAIIVPVLTWLVSGTGIAAMGVAAGVGEAIYSAVSQPDTDALNAQIAANAALSNEARATAQDALAKYNTGVLSSAYQGMYQAQYDQRLAQVRQDLATRGFTEGSTQWQSAMQSFNQWDANLKGTLLQNQLSDAVKASGMSSTAANEFLIKYGIDVKQQQVTATQQKGAGGALAKSATGLAKLFPGETETTTGDISDLTEPISVFDLNALTYQPSGGTKSSMADLFQEPSPIIGD